MLRLKVNAGPEWVDLGPGVRALLRPMSSAIYQSVLADSAVVAEMQTGDAISFGDAVRKAVLARVILEWEGVGDLDGNPLPPTPDAVAALLDQRHYCDGFDAAYFAAWLMVGEEKNGLSPVPDGTSGGALTIAETVAPPARIAPIANTNP